MSDEAVSAEKRRRVELRAGAPQSVAQLVQLGGAVVETADTVECSALALSWIDQLRVRRTRCACAFLT